MLPVLIYITAPNREEAISLAHELLNQKLIACANIVDHVTSLYWWRGEIEQNNEVILIAKTLPSHTEQVIKHVQEKHSYECPAIVTIPITGGSQEYIDWVSQQVTPAANQ